MVFPVSAISVDDETRPLFAFVLERDIDFLLVEELSCSDQFRAFVMERCLPGTDVAGANWFVRHSIGRTGTVSGETDIELTLLGGSLPGTVKVLFENKVDAEFQPDQALRYRDEATRAMEELGCWRVVTCLLAPAAYLAARAGAADFHSAISYEDVLAHLADRASTLDGELGHRLAHRVSTIEQAILKARRGYVPVRHDGITDFWSRYWEVASAEASSLRMRRPSVRGGKSWWIRFSDAIVSQPPLPPAFLIHKLEKGRVQLEFPGWASRLELLVEAVKATEPGFEAWPAQKSAAIAVPVPLIDPSGNFDDQVESVRAGLAAAVRLQEWWQRHRDVLLKVAATDPH